jgi:hypothetical protein
MAPPDICAAAQRLKRHRQTGGLKKGVVHSERFQATIGRCAF